MIILLINIICDHGLNAKSMTKWAHEASRPQCQCQREGNDNDKSFQIITYNDNNKMKNLLKFF